MIAKRARSAWCCRSVVAALLCAALQAIAGEKLLVLAVTVNGAPGGTWALLERDGALYAPLGAFKEWRLLLTHAGASQEHRGRSWRDVSTIPGYKAEFNVADQAVALTFDAAQFQNTQLGQGYQRAQLGPVLPAAWLNYDLAWQRIAGPDLPAQRSLGALTELGWSGAAGVFSSTGVAREVGAPTTTEGDGTRQGSSYPRNDPRWTRLETNFRADDQDSNITLLAGDSSTRAGIWGRSVYFGGIQVGRNFALSPGMQTYPRPLLAGQSAAPSVLELYVDDVLRTTERIPAGPFAIDNLPHLTGAGQVRVVVRDLLGRETVVQDDFHAVAQLLAPGLADFSIQAGRLREQLGITSNDYGAKFGSGLFRYGLEGATVELRGEYSRATSSAGMGLSVALPWQMIGTAAAAVSQDTAGNGKRAVVELQRPTLRHSFSARYERTSADWREIGAAGLMPRSITSARYTTRNGIWYAGLAAARIERFGAQPFTTASANLAVRLGRSSTMTITATRITGGAFTANALGLSVVIPLGATMINAGVSGRDGGTDAYATVSRNPGVGLGLGASGTLGTLAGQEYAEASLAYEGQHAHASAQGHTERAFSAARLGLQGAFVVSDGTVFATRALRTSFAIVEAKGLDDVGVKVQSALTARTDASGKALVANLQPYRENRIQLDANDVPMGAELDSIDRTAVPRSRSGVKVLFPVRPGRAALLVVTLADGTPAPIGASLEVGERVYVVGSRGRAFVTGLEPGSVGRLSWDQRSCSVALELPAGDVDAVPTVPVVCR